MRIGNLFERDGNILEVVRISKDGAINYEIVEKSKGQHVNGGVVRPIPLTEEWLLRLGFEKKQKTPALTVFNKDNFQVRFDPLDKFQFYIKGRYLNLNHVHQLQNLYFALTNTELECTSR